MGFLRKLFGPGEPANPSNVDNGFFLYAQCGRCGEVVRLRVDPQHELNREGEGYVWHKTIVDSRCFRPIPTVVHFDRQYGVTSAEIDGGRYVTQEEYDAAHPKAGG